MPCRRSDGPRDRGSASWPSRSTIWPSWWGWSRCTVKGISPRPLSSIRISRESLMKIIERIDQWGRTTPDRPAHKSGGRTLTYGELCRRSDSLAAHLAGSLPEKAPVVVLGHKEPELLIAYLGAIKSGRAYVPVDTVVPAQRIERIAAASGAPMILTPEKVAELSGGSEPAPPWRLEEDDHYYIMF